MDGENQQETSGDKKWIYIKIPNSKKRENCNSTSTRYGLWNHRHDLAKHTNYSTTQKLTYFTCFVSVSSLLVHSLFISHLGYSFSMAQSQRHYLCTNCAIQARLAYMFTLYPQSNAEESSTKWNSIVHGSLNRRKKENETKTSERKEGETLAGAFNVVEHLICETFNVSFPLKTFPHLNVLCFIEKNMLNCIMIENHTKHKHSMFISSSQTLNIKELHSTCTLTKAQQVLATIVSSSILFYPKTTLEKAI
ncbi:CLUMA_CG010192, isoform A [Clunio marinus]|uniref:CLUMA_CG010192, isoform A n=1 Tax=Clunio marinus TaxID=568069 RepID=A0A1J1ICU9_9DIPT|nr:CLUMA_CG010192, isoform A [Clunio marinus]